MGGGPDQVWWRTAQLRCATAIAQVCGHAVLKASARVATLSEHYLSGAPHLR